MLVHARMRAAAVARPAPLPTHRWISLAAVAALALLIEACTPVPPVPLAGPDPADPRTRVPAVAYRSPVGPYGEPAAGRAVAMAGPERPHRPGTQAMRRAMPHLPSRSLPAMLAGLAVLLAGCAGFSPDGGMGAVQDIAGAELGKDVVALRTPDDADVAHATVRRLLKRPLTADAAVQIALLNNRDLQAAYSSLGISEAALVKASLPPNPTFSVSDIAGGGAFEFERVVVVSILALATLPARTEIAGDRFRQAQLKAAHETLRVAAQTRRAYYQAVAERTLAHFLEEATASRSGDCGANFAASRRKRRPQQARPGPRPGVLRRPDRGDRQRAPPRHLGT